MTSYVAGFLFNEDKTKVALIEKQRPQWQAGLLNGIGGHIEKGETSFDAMRREFKEETGVENIDWNSLITLAGSDWEVHFFYGFGDITKVRSLTDEIVVVVDINPLPENIIDNLKWLIPMALDPALTSYSRVEI